MTQDEIIRMARQSGLGWVAHKRLERFAALVAAHEREKQADTFIGFDAALKEAMTIEAAVLAEREACAKVCEEKRIQMNYSEAPYNQCAAAIRARPIS